tara:strand:+ start:723 stop:1769 length:1047 start_codon:yes stop_codon:yes gene_type:complete
MKPIAFVPALFALSFSVFAETVPAEATESARPPDAAKTEKPILREFRMIVNVDAEQDWYKNDPEYPGDQYSKGWTKQRYEFATRLRSTGKLQVRNLLHPNLEERLEAKVIHLARQAKSRLEAQGKPFKLPETPEERAAFMREFNERLIGCAGNEACRYELNMHYGAILAAMDYPGALEEDTVPGQFLYFEPYSGCPEASRVTLETRIEGVRYNKTSDKFVPFVETHQADTKNREENLPYCAHMLAVIDTLDEEKPMWQETIFIPQPFGVTEYTESGHTSRSEEPQSMPTAVLDWMTERLRHAKSSGSDTVEIPLPLPLNANSTWLGRFKGVAKVTMKWSFEEVEATAQ